MPGVANPQALNRYSYVLGNPIRYNDPIGHMCSDPEDHYGNGCDGGGLYLTGIGLIFPQLNIPSSASSVINDLSRGFYFLPDPLQCPPAGPYCDGKYHC